MKELIQEHLHSGSHLSKKHVHPKMMKLFEAGGLNAVFERAEGQYLWDMDGNRYLDLLSGGGVYLLGRNHPAIHQACRDVLDLDIPNLTIVNASVMSGMLAERMLDVVGPHYSKVLFSNTGSETMDLCIRFTRFVTRRRRFLYLEGAFHGRTFAGISMCGSPALREGMEPLLPTCTPIKPNDLDALENELSKGDVAGFFFEPVQGMTGTVLTPEYLKAAEELCQRYGTIMVADEVQSGLCRTGSWFASLDAGIRPGMIAVSKILSGGAVPVAACVLTEELYENIYSKFKSGPVYFSTFAENNLAMAAGIATLDTLKEMDAPRRAAEIGDLLRGGMERLAEKYDVFDRIEGKGLLQVIYFKNSNQLSLKLQQAVMGMADTAAFGAAINVDMYRKKRIIVQIPGTNVNGIKILPPVIMTNEDIEWYLESLEDVIASYYNEAKPIVSVSSSFLKSAFANLKKRIPADFIPPALSGAPAAGTGGIPTLDSEGKKKNDGPAHHPEIVQYHHYDGDIDEHCDFLIVGSGPGGAIAARQLAKTGKRVIMVEAGPIADPSTFVEDPMATFNRYFWESGLRTTRGNVMMPTLHVRALGGGSVFNSAICLRMPPHQIKRWSREHGIDGMTEDSLRPHFEEIEALMGIAPTPVDVQGKRNLLFKLGADKLGISSEPINRNVDGCRGSARCVVGCPNRAKQSHDLRVVPEIIADGGRVLTSIQIDKLIMRGNRCGGAYGNVVDPTTGKKKYNVRITAKCTILAAGCLHTPVIMQRSGVKRDLAGKNLRAHPGIFTLGEYNEEILPWTGATQGYHSLQYLEEGIKLETLWVSAPLIAARFPGLGVRYKELLSNYRNMSVFDAWVSGDDSVGRVLALPGGGKDITWNLGMGDVRRIKEATALTAELLFASGSHTVYTGLPGEHNVLYDAEDAARIRTAEFQPKDFVTGSQHLFGTTPMGADIDRHVVDSHGKVHQVDDLYIADTGIMPISPGVNPMHPLMAIVNKMGKEIGQRY